MSHNPFYIRLACGHIRTVRGRSQITEMNERFCVICDKKQPVVGKAERWTRIGESYTSKQVS